MTIKPILTLLAAYALPHAVASADPLPVAAGPFQPSWDSLAHYQCPDWFRDAKFGIWAHWTAQCVPEQGDWYARSMYLSEQVDKKTGKAGGPSAQYKYHLAHYGHPSKFGFKDIDNLWKADKWEPEKLIALYKRAGAKYFVALANHHDNFDCYDSKYQPWNSVNIGPKKDIVGGWAKAARAAGLRFGVTVHAARTWSWFEVAQGGDKTGPMKGVPYDGKLTKADGKGTWWEGYDPQDLYAQNHKPGEKPSREYCDKFYNRTIDLIDKYQPDLLYFDDGVLPLRGTDEQYGLKIAAHLYNSSARQHGGNEAVMNTKHLNEAQRKALVWDIERGKSDRIEPQPWQTDTCIGAWHYLRALHDRHGYKKPQDVIRMLVDIVSKNGNLLLNVPVRGDGTIDEEEVACLEGIASWMKAGSECIFGTRPWRIYGEGPSTGSDQEKNRFGGVKDVSGKPYTQEDIRFTASKDGKTLYAICLEVPRQPIRIKSLSGMKIAGVSLVGGDAKLEWKQDADALVIQPLKTWPCDYVVAFGIRLAE